MNAPAFKFEKRATPRHTFELEGAADVVNRRVAPGVQGMRVRTVNVGGGGVMMTHDGEVNVGDLLQLTFRAGFGEEPLVVTAQVVWQRRNAVRLLGFFTAGLVFRPGGQADAAELAARAGDAASRGTTAPERAAVVEGGAR